MTPLGVGVIGAGVVGEMRVRTMRRTGAVRFAAIADVDLERARRVARPGNAKIVGDYRDLIHDQSVDVVIVSSPVQLHEEMTLAALRAGKHVLCEKPLSNTVDSCRRMLEAAADARKTLAVGFNHRYYPSFRQLKQIVAAGELGPIDHVRAFGGHEGMSQFRAPWMYERATLGGGAMMDVGIHVADLVRHLGFRADHVTAVVTNGVWNVPGSEDNAIVLARTAEGIPISYQATWSEWKGYRLRLEVYGRDGMALAHYPPLLNLLVRRGPDGRRRRTWTLHPWLNLRERVRGWQVTAEDAFAAELDEFLRLVRDGQGDCGTGLDGLRAVQFAEAAVRSSETRQPVRITD